MKQQEIEFGEIRHAKRLRHYSVRIFLAGTDKSIAFFFRKEDEEYWRLVPDGWYDKELHDTFKSKTLRELNISERNLDTAKQKLLETIEEKGLRMHYFFSSFIYD